MALDLSVSSAGGPWDVIYTVGSNSMGFITANPATVRQVSPFAVSIRTGGEAAYSQDTYQQSVFTGFYEGGDKLVFGDDAKYQWSNGKVALHREDYITLASQWESSDASQVATAREILDFDTSSCAQPWIVYAADTVLRAFNTTTEVWANACPSGTPFGNSIVHISLANGKMYISFGSAANSQSWTGASLTTGFAATAVAADRFIQGTIQSVTYWRSLSGDIYKYTGSWSAAIPVGNTDSSISDIYEYKSWLLIAKPEGLYSYDGTNVNLLIKADVTISTNNFRGMGAWLTNLYLPWLNAVHQATISSATSITNTDITPLMQGDTAKERYGHGIPIRCIAGPRKSYIAFDDGEGLYPEVLSHDGIGYQQIYRGTSGDTMYAIGYSPTMGWLVVNDGSTRIKRLINTGDAEYPSFNTSGEFHTPGLDGGYPDELKAYRSIKLTTEDCVEDNEDIVISYRIDDGSWVEAGTVDTDGFLQETILDLDNGHVVGKKLEFKLVLSRRAADETKTPKIKLPIIVRLLVLPDPIDSYSEEIDLKLTTKTRDGKTLNDDGYTIQERLDFLYDARSSPYPIVRTDEWGRVTYLKITDMGQDPKRFGTSDEGILVSLNLLDLSPGLVRQLSTDQLTITDTLTSEDIAWDEFYAFGVGSIGLSYCEG